MELFNNRFDYNLICFIKDLNKEVLNYRFINNK